MAFYPNIDDTLTIEKVTYRFTEHPGAQGMSIPYGQAGRRGTVYQLSAPAGSLHALKVFTHSFRVPRNAEGAEGLRPFASLPGLQVCARIVLIPPPNNSSVTRPNDLDYAVLMPWVAGTTWQQIMLGRQPISAEQSCALAQALAHILQTMETRNLAHCDLSAPNVLVTLDSPSVSLVDVEDLYAPGLSRPEKLPGGSSGYAHRTAPQGLWGPISDRFAGAVLLTEMLSWCDERVRQIACRETYFDPNEMQQNSERLHIMLGVLRERHGVDVAEAFAGAWYSSTLDECPSLARWAQLLNPSEAKVREVVQLTRDRLEQLVLLMVETANSLLDLGEIDRAITESAEAYRQAPHLPEAANVYTRALLMRGKTKEQKGDLEGALIDYRAALAVTPSGGMQDELVAMISSLEKQIIPDPYAPGKGTSTMPLSTTVKPRERGNWGKPRRVPPPSRRYEPNTTVRGDRVQHNVSPYVLGGVLGSIIACLALAVLFFSYNSSQSPTVKYLVIETTKGRIVAKLHTDPSLGVRNTIANFERKANSGHFNGRIFHRAEDWLIQGGDPLGTGTGGGGMPSEYNQLPFTIGSLGVARGSDPAVNNDSQFFIVKSDVSQLNGLYTNWGQVVEGMEIVNQIAVGDRMTKVTVEERK